MKPTSQQRLLIDGTAGALETVVNDPSADVELTAKPAPRRRGIALIAHPHPLFGGSLDNKVVQTLAKTFFAQGYVAVRMNFRGVGATAGVHDEGVGETEDWLVVVHQMRERYGSLPLLLAGFSFGAYVQSRVARRLHEHGAPATRLVLVAPAVGRFHVEPVPQDTLVIHGEEDDVVPLPEVLAWARPQRLPVVVLPGAGHFFHGSLVELQRIIQFSCSCLAAG
ncbi:MAG TPA: alpha/beta hydrolase [Burkholderiales bacterium]|nr:alpha/beta hydrolase [Burkholderiales bacterium]